ncbi:hypothetical protein NDU88_000017 [Pleurodeles waltl]|uniref:Secreted protein n=1 Tax=Pleurodeles waltl TaxID=8319 RepID=A0AAV7TDU3_PLEWA|nr:hypothetical protein NDU88_000017 [Pleurodeles waltl]
MLSSVAVFAVLMSVFWELGVAPGRYRQENRRTPRVFWELGVAPGRYRQENRRTPRCLLMWARTWSAIYDYSFENDSVVEGPCTRHLKT